MSTIEERTALWEYYAAVAECFGKKVNKKENKITHSAFSLYWFFYKMLRKELDGESGLVGAYFGKEDALKNLDWNENLPTGWDCYFVGEYPMNASQQASVKMSLANPISFIQGPPGTGKTATILNMMSCIVGMGKTVAVVSGNGSAVKNVEDKIAEYSEEDKNQNGYKLKQKFAPLGNKQKREAFNESVDNLSRKAFKFENTKDILIEGEQELSWSHEKSIKACEFLKEYPAVTSTIHSVLSLFADSLDYKFDYVIMDESSQTSVVNGLLAMYCAKHLILVGDLEQLPPVVMEDKLVELKEEKEKQILKQMPFFDEAYDIKLDRSFLESCQKFFSAVCPDKQMEIMLNQHFRCHPGIFDFCKQYIYDPLGKGELSIKTLNYNDQIKCPIRVLWFEGDYAESCLIGKVQAKEPVDKNDKEEMISQVCFGDKGRPLTSKRNMRQVQIFMEEEWPRIEKYLKETENPSVCILTPYKGMLYELRERFFETTNKEWLFDSVVAKNIEGEKKKLRKKDFYVEITGDDKDDDGDRIASLTIHKSQGQEFDLVYLLPVDDGDWEWPWSQNKRLINVAVSRAKKELCVVVSSCLMEKELQEKLTGYYVAPAESKYISAEEVEEREPQERFLRKLMQYIWGKNQGKCEGEYGFHKAKSESIFADCARIRAWENTLDRKSMLTHRNKKADEEEISANELCAISHITQMEVFKEKNMVLYYNVRVDELLQENRSYAKKEAWDNIQNYQARLNAGMHFDLVICKDDNIQCVIEIDGGYHRKYPGIRKDSVERLADRLMADQIKDTVAKDIFQIPLLRWRSDGAGKSEWMELEKVLEKSIGSNLKCHPEVRSQIMWQEKLKMWEKYKRGE